MTQPREKYCEPDIGRDHHGIPDVHLTQPKGGLGSDTAILACRVG